MTTSASHMTEDERAYLQERMATLGKAMFIVSLIMFSLDLHCILVGRDAGPVYVYFINPLIWLAFWQICLRGKYSARALHRMSFAALLSSIVVVTALGRLFLLRNFPRVLQDFGLNSPEQQSAPVVGLMLGFMSLNFMMGAVLTVALRAAVVPSTRAQTVRVTLLLGLPLILINTFGAGPLEPPRSFVASVGPEQWWITLMSGIIWWAIATFVCAMISGIVHGLRREVREARQLGQYNLERKIGEGGMGVVYQANHALLRRSTAIKLLLPEKAGETNLKRFEQEVRLTARLTHPNTVTVFDYGHTPDGLFYYAMELLDGADLEQIVKVGGAMPTGRALKVLGELAGALEEAHGIGLIHRDIKPGNVILCTRGGKPDVAKLVDFGLVKELAEGGDAGLTNPDAVIGTPLYLAPEVMKSPDEVSEKSDLYALGAVGYFLLTGHHVFEGRTLVEIMGHHMHTEPQKLGERRGESIAEDVETLILECLAKSPADRPGSARELLARIVACREFGDWSEDAARTWWQEHSVELSQAKADTSSTLGTRTLAIALGEGARGAA